MRKITLTILVMLLSFQLSSNDNIEAQKPNLMLEKALAQHEKERSPDSHLKLLLALGEVTYYIPGIDDAIVYEEGEVSGEKSKFKFRLSRAPADGRPLLPIFTTREKLSHWASGKVDSVWNVSAQQVWRFSKDFKLDVVVNPVTSGWIMTEKTITWLQNQNTPNKKINKD